MAKKKYTDDYEIITSKDGKKSTVYLGDYFEVSLDQEGLVKFKRQCTLLLAVIVVLHISGGFLDNQGMYQFYVALPFALAFFPLLYMTDSILRLPKEKRKLRREEVGLSFDRLKTTSKILIFFLGVGALSEIVFILFILDGGQSGLDYQFLLVESLATVAVFYIVKFQSQIHVQVSPEKD